MLHFLAGDILLSKAQAIAHGVAPNDNFHSGLALALRERWPAMASDFRHYCHGHHPRSGDLWTWGGVGGVRVVCLMTQDEAYEHGTRPGRAHLEHVNHSLKKLRRTIEKEGFTSLALPRLATGIGGLDWDDVRPLIQEHLGDLKIPVIVYETFHPSVAAVEPVA